MRDSNENNFYVTRQSYWHSGVQGVEISRGPDSSSPDALARKYDGEFQGFEDPREAASTALRIAAEWGKDSKEPILLFIVGTAPQMGVYPDESEAFTPEQVTEWGEKKYAKLQAALDARRDEMEEYFAEEVEED